PYPGNDGRSRRATSRSPSPAGAPWLCRSRIRQSSGGHRRGSGGGGPPDGPRSPWARAAGRFGLVRLEHVAQHVLQDAAVVVVVGLAGGVDAHHRVELDGVRTILA